MWETALAFTLKLVGLILDQAQANAEVRAAFAAFVGTIEKTQMVPSRLKTSYERQLEKLKNKDGGGN